MQTRRFDPERDGELVFAVYASTRRCELASWGFGEAAAQAFLAMQHRCQLASYAQAYPEAERRVLLWGERAVGYVHVDRKDRLFHLIDIAILPELQNRGLGSAVLEELKREARAANAEIQLQVRPDNRVLYLYQRLGFVVLSAGPTAIAMAWRPSDTQPQVQPHA